MFLFIFILFFYGNNSHEVKVPTRVMYGIFNTFFIFLCSFSHYFLKLRFYYCVLTSAS